MTTDHGGAASPRTEVMDALVAFAAYLLPDDMPVRAWVEDAIKDGPAKPLLALIEAAQGAPAPEGLRAAAQAVVDSWQRGDIDSDYDRIASAFDGLLWALRAEARPPEGLDPAPAPPFVEAALALVDAVLDRVTADPDDDAAKAARKVLRTDWTARSAGGATKP